MNTYTFSTINDKDFEVLVLDLLNTEFSLNLQNFKGGKDGGIDLRYSSNTNKNEIVVQAKHYLKSGNKKLISDLKVKELKKVKAINPNRYIIATSLELSSKEKDDIVDIFKPYIKSANDVFSNNDLNKLLRKHKEIEKQHFKLWFSSIEILNDILNNAIEGRTKSYLERIKIKLPLYVLTKNFDDANKILAREKLLLITGLPGVGKTTLAEALLFNKAKAKYKIYLVRTIREAEDVMNRNPKQRQVFYFDDFLGEVYYEIVSGSQKESEIADFVDRVKHEQNKFLILSTRTVIFQQAKEKSEKIKRSRIDTGKYVLELDSYNNLEKARILYNHLFFQNLEDKFFKAIIENEFYMWIIKHTSYSPRMIEFITDKKRIKNFSKFEFQEFIKKHLNHPEEIWRDSYLNQIEYLDRCLLQTMFTFPRGQVESDLRKAFEQRLIHEKKINNKEISEEQFSKSIKNLQEGFIISTLAEGDKTIRQYSFINPSLADFLVKLISEDYSIKKAIIKSAIYLEQFEIFDVEKGKFSFELELQEIVKDNIQKEMYDSLDSYKEFKFIGYQMEILIRFCKDIAIDEPLFSLIQNIDLQKIWWIKKGFSLVLKSKRILPKTKQYITENFYSLISAYMEKIDDTKTASKIPKLFKRYGFDYNEFIKNQSELDKVLNMITRLSNEKENDLIQTFVDDVEDWDDFDDLVYSELRAIESKLSNKILPKEVTLDIPRQFDEEKLEEHLNKSRLNRMAAKERESSTKVLYTEISNRAKIENEKIKDLFDRKNYS